MSHNSGTLDHSRMRNTRSKTKLVQKWGLNSSHPISRLPAEILLLIFQLVRLGHQQAIEELTKQQEKDVPVDNGIKTFVQIGWIVVTYVCRRWREAALGSASLWTNIEVEDRRCRWATEMLKRSKKTLLTICLDLSIMNEYMRQKRTRTAVARATLANVQKQMTRCIELKIAPDPYNHFRLESALAGYPMPKLSSLTIEIERVYIPDTLSDDVLKANSLCTLKLVNVQLDWDSKFLLGLTSLTFHPYRQTLPLHHLLDHLAMIPALKQLDIQLYYVYYFFDQDLQLARDHPLKSQPLELTHLSITGCPIPVTILLQCVARKSVCLDLGIREPWDQISTQEHLVALLAAISDHIRGVKENGRSLRRCTINHRKPDKFMLSGRLHDFPSRLSCDSDDADGAPFNLKLTFEESGGPEGPTLIQTIFQHLPFRDLLALSFTFSYPFSSTDWLSTFGTIPTLKNLHLDSHHALAFFEAFCKDAFLALEEISCANADILLRKFIISPLLRCLHLRHKRGAPLETLILHNVQNLSPKDEQTLRSLVGDLQVDS